MKVYNHTPLDDKALRDVLSSAASAAGCRPVKNVIVKVIKTREHFSGVAYIRNIIVTKAKGGRIIENKNHNKPLKPFLIAVLDVPRTKKM